MSENTPINHNIQNTNTNTVTPLQTIGLGHPRRRATLSQTVLRSVSLNRPDGERTLVRGPVREGSERERRRLRRRATDGGAPYLILTQAERRLARRQTRRLSDTEAAHVTQRIDELTLQEERLLIAPRPALVVLPDVLAVVADVTASDNALGLTDLKIENEVFPVTTDVVFPLAVAPSIHVEETVEVSFATIFEGLDQASASLFSPTNGISVEGLADDIWKSSAQLLTLDIFA